MENLVLYEVKDRVGYLTLNRPEKKNALSFEMVSAIKSNIEFAQKDENCKVIVIKSNGDAFCSGADLASLQKLQSNTYDENLADSLHLMELFKLIYLNQKVVITMIQGTAFAGGCGLATIADFCFASRAAKFSYTEVKIGFIPAIVMIFLIRKIGEANAKRLLLSGEIIQADDALKLNLINNVVDDEIIEEYVHDFAIKLCKQNSGNSMMLTKQMIAEVQNMSLDEALMYAANMNAQARSSADCKKGINAFLNKEKLTW
ncbi:MAG: enoyl-CoA hydratase/isomerase family protein [Bacteroidia bacterium]